MSPRQWGWGPAWGECWEPGRRRLGSCSPLGPGAISRRRAGLPSDAVDELPVGQVDIGSLGAEISALDVATA